MRADAGPPVKISVLIPAYNGLPYIGEAIESVLGQTERDFELIVADDGSTDGTQALIQSYVKRDSRVRLCQNDRNLGCVRNINSLILASRGEYIKVLIQDDVLALTCLERFAEILDSRRDVALVTSYQRFIGERSVVRKIPTLPAIGQLAGKRVQADLLAHGNWIGGETAVMFRRGSLSVGLFNPNWIWQVDQDLWLRILAHGDLYVVPEILTYPRIHARQTTVTHNTGFTFIREELMQRRIAFMAPEIYGRYSSKQQAALLEPHLDRLIEKGCSGDGATHSEMLQLGRQYGGVRFWRRLAKRQTKALWWPAVRAWRQRVEGLRRRMEARDWKRRFGFRREISTVDLGFGTIEAWGRMRLPLELLRCPLLSHGGWRVLPLEHTPHYAWISDLVERRDDTGSRQAYRRYIELFHPEEQPTEALAKVEELVRTLASMQSHQQPVTIAVHPPAVYRGQYCAVIYDGNHRACIAKATRQRHIDCRVVGVRMHDDYFPANVFDTEAREIEAWVERGRPARPPHAIKVQTLKDYARRFSLARLVETGTYRGDMIEACRDTFDSIVSIELSAPLFESARARFATDPAVTILQGDSGEVLPRVLASVREPALFWLDAHYSGGSTAKGAAFTPIYRELEAILAHPADGHVVLVDDAADFVGEEDYPTVEQLRQFVKERRPGHRFEIADDIIRIHA
jgi:glycosyltransferase involved in cell wall biosynthesis